MSKRYTFNRKQVLSSPVKFLTYTKLEIENCNYCVNATQLASTLIYQMHNATTQINSE